jgi:hypothetical protein
MNRYTPKEYIQMANTIMEKNISSHQGNTNQNHNEISFHLSSNGYYQKKRK